MDSSTGMSPIDNKRDIFIDERIPTTIDYQSRYQESAFAQAKVSPDHAWDNFWRLFSDRDASYR